MKKYYPSYYKKFKCDPWRCRHNCCIGWEIDIDDDTLEFYDTYSGKLKEDFKKYISLKDEPHFILGENERCPFLNDKNLCRIILELGEDKLCNICKDHPRFRNFMEERTETGLGMCCEIAAEIILQNKEKVMLISDDDSKAGDIETDFLKFRDNIFEILQNRKKPLNERINLIYQLIGVELKGDFSYWKEFFKTLECLDVSWFTLLDKCIASDFITEGWEKYEISFEQLIVYFIFRHLYDGVEDGFIKERILFSILSMNMIITLFLSSQTKTFEELKEISRMYSSEIEYSENNIYDILNEIVNLF